MSESVPRPNTPEQDAEFLSRLAAAVRRYRQAGGPCRGDFLVDGMRVVFEEQYLGWPPPERIARDGRGE